MKTAILSPASVNHRRAFTLIELMMVISIIIILTAMLFATLNIFRRSQMQATTQVTMSQLSRALTTYLDNYGTFGEDPEYRDFIASPIEFLVHRRQAMGLQALFTPGAKNWAQAAVPSAQRYQIINDPLPGITTTEFSTVSSSVNQATHVMDGFANPLLITILRRPIHGSNWTRPSLIILSSTRGDPSDAEYIEMYYNDGEQLIWNNRGYPNSDGTWDLFDAEKYIVSAIEEAGGGGGGGGDGGGGGGDGGGKGGGKGKNK